MKAINFPGFENIRILLLILATIPVILCKCERAFSALQRLKNYNQSTMVDDHLGGLALLYVNQEIHPDIHKIIYVFANDKEE